MTEYNNSSLSFPFELVGAISLDRNYCEVTNLLFVSPELYLNILKTEKILQCWDKKFSTCVGRLDVIPAQEVVKEHRNFFCPRKEEIVFQIQFYELSKRS